MTGIYKITNKENGRIYVGKSKDIMQRWSMHERALQKHNHHSTKLQEDFDKYGGISAFDFSIVELCEPSELNEKEKYYQAQFDSINNGYNGNEIDDTGNIHAEITLTRKTYEELQNRLGGSYLTTYLYIRFHMNDKNKITINQSALAEYFGVSVMTIAKHIRILLDNSIIRNVGKSGLYNIFEVLI